MPGTLPAAAAPLPFYGRRCEVCRDPIPKTGKAGRPPKVCDSCRESGATPPPQTVDLAALRNRLALNNAETAALLGIAESTLRDLWAAGGGPPRIKVGARRLCPTHRVIQWLDEQVAEQAEEGRA